jgi:hypothetical protein
MSQVRRRIARVLLGGGLEARASEGGNVEEGQGCKAGSAPQARCIESFASHEPLR